MRVVIITALVLTLLGLMRGDGDDCPPYSWNGCEAPPAEPVVLTPPYVG